MAETSTRQLNITPEEVQSGKTFAIVAYFVFFVPLLIEEQRKNKFVMFHTEQATLLAVVNIVIFIIKSVLFAVAFTGYYSGFGIYSLLNLGFLAVHIAVFVLWIMALIGAANGKYEPMPVLGQYAEKLNFVK